MSFHSESSIDEINDIDELKDSEFINLHHSDVKCSILQPQK